MPKSLLTCLGCQEKLVGFDQGGKTVLSNAPGSVSSLPPVPQC